jgi:hypothetical protein
MQAVGLRESTAPVFLVSDGLQPEADDLVRAASSQGWHVLWLHRSQATAPPLDPSRRIAFYGDTFVGRDLARSESLALIEPTLDILVHLSEVYTKRQIRFGTLADLMETTTSVFAKSADTCYRLMSSGICKDGKPNLLPDKLADPASPVLMAEPVHWLAEYRVIVLERQILTHSLYMRSGKRFWQGEQSAALPSGEEAEVLDHCRRLLEDPSVALPPACALDVGFIEGRGWAIVEFNPIWCSRLFGCNRGKVLPALERACVFRKNMNSDDARWILRGAKPGSNQPQV